MSDMNVAMHQARRIELYQHRSAPAGVEAHANGVRHEVQRGDGAIAIAREYSQAYHMDVSADRLIRANSAAFADGLTPGELLRIPGLQARTDAMFLGRNPGLSRVGDRLVHTVARGETLASLARSYNDANDLQLSWKQLYAANKAAIGPDPGRLRAGQRLAIPGITTASPKATAPTLSALDNDVVLTRTARVRHEDGSVESIDVMRYRVDGSHAESFATFEEAAWMARNELQDDVARSNPLAIVQTRDGAFQLVPLRGSEVSSNLDDSDQTLSLAYRAAGPSVTAVVEERWDTGAVETRRFDR